MGHNRNLHKAIDTDLVERIFTYGSQTGSRTTTSKLVGAGKKPRAADTYRAARRNRHRNSHPILGRHSGRGNLQREGFKEHGQVTVGAHLAHEPQNGGTNGTA